MVIFKANYTLPREHNEAPVVNYRYLVLEVQE